MNGERIALAMLIHFAFGLVLLAVLWPTERTTDRFLRRWGAGEPVGAQRLVVAGYLRTRRLLCPVILVMMPPVVAAVLHPAGHSGPVAGATRMVFALVTALLLAETVAALRPVRGVRTALARWKRHELVPTWALAVLVSFAALTMVLGGIGLAAQPWAARFAAALPPNGPAPDGGTVHIADGYRAEMIQSPGWLIVTGTVLCLGIVLGLVRLGMRRPAVADPEADAVLRVRTGRVVVGLGIGLLACLATVGANRIDFLHGLSAGNAGPAAPGWLAPVHSPTQYAAPVLILIAIVCWIRVTGSPGKKTRTPGTFGVRSGSSPAGSGG